MWLSINRHHRKKRISKFSYLITGCFRLYNLLDKMAVSSLAPILLIQTFILRYTMLKRTYLKDLQELYRKIESSTDGQASIENASDFVVGINLRHNSGFNAHASFYFTVRYHFKLCLIFLIFQNVYGSDLSKSIPISGGMWQECVLVAFESLASEIEWTF